MRRYYISLKTVVVNHHPKLSLYAPEYICTYPRSLLHGSHPRPLSKVSLQQCNTSSVLINRYIA
jgi:hypothetical protein